MKNQSSNTVIEKNRSLFSDPYETHNYTVWAEFRIAVYQKAGTFGNHRALKGYIFGIKTSQFMLYREITTVCSQIYTKHINTLWAESRIV
jgi:hypothetical protein